MYNKRNDGIIMNKTRMEIVNHGPVTYREGRKRKKKGYLRRPVQRFLARESTERHETLSCHANKV